jgi:hypothetical protein
MPRLAKLDRGIIVASALLAAGVTGTAIDPNGPVGITLFGVAVAAALYLIARPFRTAVQWLSAAARPNHVPRRTLARVVRGRTLATVVAAMGVLFAVWLTTDLPRPLVYACWWGLCLLAAWLIAVAVLTAHHSRRTAR